MAKALINPAMLRWARDRAGFSIKMLAEKLNNNRPDPQMVAAWEQQKSQPTFKQAENIARITHIPFGYLFLPEPPQEESLPIPDLRTQGDMPIEPPSIGFLDLIRDVAFQQDWYRDYRIEQGATPLPFVGKYQIVDNVQTIAKDIRATLKLEDSDKTGNWEAHFSGLCDLCEEIGIRVMRSGYFGSNTRQTFDVDEFLGFAMSDPIVPLIFINGRDAKARQIFTLGHELAHIWLGESGISNLRLDDANPGRNARIERVCNAVAAEVLVPKSHFLHVWDHTKSLDNNSDTLIRLFKVSSIVIARRAVDLGKINWEEFNTFYSQEEQNQKKASGRGGNYYLTVPIKNGRKFTSAVLSRTMSGQLLLRDAGSLLHMKPANIQKLYYQQS